MKKSTSRDDDGCGKLHFMMGVVKKRYYWYDIICMPLCTYVTVKSNLPQTDSSTHKQEWQKVIEDRGQAAELLEACRFDISDSQLLALFVASGLPKRLAELKYE